MSVGHSDSECKISVFGKGFVFALAGLARNGAQKWDAHSVALQAWREAAPHHNTAAGLVHAVAESWTTKMKALLDDPALIRAQRSRMKPGDDPVLENALFAATDTSGTLAVYAVNVEYDLKLFDSAGTVSILHDGSNVKGENSPLTGGHDEITREFFFRRSPRAKEYMSWFQSRISHLAPSEQQAEIASKLIELSILLHPQNDQLGFPIDVVQLRRKSGIYERSMKPNCGQTTE